MRILYVEDNPANLFLIKRVAKMGDHEVVNLIDGEEALRKIDIIKPDLILMDIQLAGQLTGLDVVRKLRGSGYSMPIVAVTAYAMVGDRERCLEAGCNEYLSKPLPIGRVVELIQLYQSGIPVEPPVNDDDSMAIPIITQVKTATSDVPQAAAPAVQTMAPASTPAAPETPAQSSTSDATPSAPAPTPAAVPETPASADVAAKGDVTESSGASMTEDKLTSASADQPAVSPSAPSEEALPATAPLSSDETAPEADSHPAVEPTSQDTSHPQGTVQTQ